MKWIYRWINHHGKRDAETIKELRSSLKASRAEVESLSQKLDNCRHLIEKQNETLKNYRRTHDRYVDFIVRLKEFVYGNENQPSVFERVVDKEPTLHDYLPKHWLAEEDKCMCVDRAFPFEGLRTTTSNKTKYRGASDMRPKLDD